MVKSVNKFNTKKTRSMFLCSVLGFLGVHEFYQHKYVKGQLFVLLCLLACVGIQSHITWLTLCFPLTFVASLISQIRLIVGKDNKDIEFCLGIVLFILQLFIFAYRPNVYSEEETITQKTEQEESIKKRSFRI